MRDTENTEEVTRFTELLHANRSRVFGYIVSLVHHHADADELFQETALLLWQKFDEFQAERDFGKWATRFAHLTVLNFIRKNRRRKVYFSEAILEKMALAHQEEVAGLAASRTEALAGCLDKLPEGERQLVEECYSGQRKMKDVAQQHGQSAAAVYKAIERARRKLLACMEHSLRDNSLRDSGAAGI